MLSDLRGLGELGHVVQCPGPAPLLPGPLPAGSLVSSYPPVPASLSLPKSTREMLSNQIGPHSACKPPPAEVIEYAQPFLCSLRMKEAGKSQANPRQMLCTGALTAASNLPQENLPCFAETEAKSNQQVIYPETSLATSPVLHLRHSDRPSLGQPVPDFCSGGAGVAQVCCSRLSQVFFQASSSGFIRFSCCPRAGPRFQHACTSQAPPSFPPLHSWAATKDLPHLHKPLWETGFQSTGITIPVHLMSSRGDEVLLSSGTTFILGRRWLFGGKMGMPTNVVGNKNVQAIIFFFICSCFFFTKMQSFILTAVSTKKRN